MLEVTLIGTYELAAAKPSLNTLTVFLVVDPVAFVLIVGRVLDCALAMPLVVQEIAVVEVLRPSLLALSVLRVLGQLSFVVRPVKVDVAAIPSGIAVKEPSFIKRLVRINLRAKAAS